MTDAEDVRAAQRDLPVDALDYPLPASLIATRPARPRDSARLLVMHIGSDRIEHRHIRDLPEHVIAGDLLVFNNTAVAPARLVGRRATSGGRVEGLFLHELPDGTWRVMLRSNGRLKPGQRIDLLDAADEPVGQNLELIQQIDGEWIVRSGGDLDATTVLDEAGRTPLPPYILKARGEEVVDDARDRQWYQTVYADSTRRHSVAAPTAGLHFTTRLLGALEDAGAHRAELTLHVGPGTFKPMTATTVGEHAMHRERFEVGPSVIDELQAVRSHDPSGARPRVIAVGTTSVRALESLPSPVPATLTRPLIGETDLLIAPPYEFRCVDGMLTNFHLPRSTLLALVAAMVGLERIRAVYAEAVQRGYRFYSYGDAMLILP